MIGFIKPYITKIQLQNGLTFIVVNWGYKQQTLDTTMWDVSLCHNFNALDCEMGENSWFI